MNIQLIQGSFSATDAIDLVTHMVHIKVKYHEGKIKTDSNEEDVKTRETKIKQLQKELFELRKFIQSNRESVEMEAVIRID
jgi:hypothetical protein